MRTTQFVPFAFLDTRGLLDAIRRQPQHQVEGVS